MLSCRCMHSLGSLPPARGLMRVAARLTPTQTRTKLVGRVIRSYATGQGAPSTPSTPSPIADLHQDQLSFQKYDGIAKAPFTKEIAQVLRAKLNPMEIEIKPDGLIYLPEIKYRRILLNAFGPGGWAMLPLSPPVIERGNLTRTYAMYCLGRYVAESVGEQQYFEGVNSAATSVEAAKSNALVRCCKDLGIASELWDPMFIEEWKRTYALEVQVENQRGSGKEKKKLWRRKDRHPFEWPWREIKVFTSHRAPQAVLPLDSGFDKTEAEVMLSGREVEDHPDAPPFNVFASPTQRKPNYAPPQQQQQHQQQQQQQHQQQQPPSPPPQKVAPPKSQAIFHEVEATPPPPPPPAAKAKGRPAQNKAKNTPPPPPVEEVAAEEEPAEVEPEAEADDAEAGETVELDLDAIVPHQFKRHVGKTWREILQDGKGRAYVSWAAQRFVGDGQGQAQALVAAAQAKGGWDQLLAS